MSLPVDSLPDCPKLPVIVFDPVDQGGNGDISDGEQAELVLLARSAGHEFETSLSDCMVEVVEDGTDEVVACGVDSQTVEVPPTSCQNNP